MEWDLKVQRFYLVISIVHLWNHFSYNSYWIMNNHQPRSHPGHDNPIPMCLMSRLFVGLVTIVTHRVCYYWDQSSGGEGLVIPGPLPGNYGKLDYGAGAGQGSQCAKHCHCHLCYVKWFDPSYDYLANFPGLIFIFSLGWKLDLPVNSWSPSPTSLLVRSARTSSSGSVCLSWSM